MMEARSTVWPEKRERRLASSDRHGQQGVAAVEFALVLPLLLLILFAIVEFGLSLYDKQMITTAAGNAARAGILYTSGTTTPLPHTTAGYVCSTATNGTGGLISLTGSAAATIKIADIGATGASPITSSTTACSTSSTTQLCAASGDMIEIQIASAFGGLTLGSNLNPLASTSSALALTSTAYAVCE